MDNYQQDDTCNNKSTVSLASSTYFFVATDDNTNLKKVKIILGQAIPSSGSGFLMCSTQIINLYYLAGGQEKIDPALIAGFGLGNFLLNAMFMSFAFGLNGALETFVSQAYGQNNLKLCSSYLHRSRVVVTITFILTFSILANSKSILILLR